MKIPGSIRIGGRKWTVKMKQKVVDDDGNLVLGLCDYQNKVITVEKGLSKALETEVFIHEFLHACLHELGTNLSAKKDEEICEDLGSILSKTFDLKLKK